jgi:hypothetical protein
MTGARSGLLVGGVPYRVIGKGPPVVVLPGLTGDNADPRWCRPPHPIAPVHTFDYQAVRTLSCLPRITPIW